MLNIENTLKILNSFNINSHKYGPTVYTKNNRCGICLDLKDPTFGFLTRGFLFDEPKNLEEFMKKYTWYKNNQETYNIKLSLSDYNTKNPEIKYIYDGKDLTLDEMLNLKEIINDTAEQIEENNTKSSFLANIRELTNYLINLKTEKNNLKTEKNNLKITENNLKFELLQQLTIYYGKERTLEKKAVSLENIVINNDSEILMANLKNIENKPLNEIENYLKSLIEITKTEELDEKYLVNIYSNSVYKYNIDILNKQIEFVKNKINSERKFNIKGSKIHNIDEELKTFLKTPNAPTKLEVYLSQNKTIIENKYTKITNINNAYSIISGKELKFSKTIKTKDISKKTIIDNLNNNFDILPKETKARLILYNSFYKNICNYIIDNNYPSIEEIKKNFDFNYYHKELEEIATNENNSHYLVNYFNVLDFKNLDTYINSIIEICKTVETTSTITIGELQAFYLYEKSNYKTLNLISILNSKENVFLITIPKNTSVIFIPNKIELDEDTKELTTISSHNIYVKSNIIDTNEQIIVHNYNKINEKYNNSDIIITKELKENKKSIFHIGELKGE